MVSESSLFRTRVLGRDKQRVAETRGGAASSYEFRVFLVAFVVHFGRRSWRGFEEPVAIS